MLPSRVLLRGLSGLSRASHATLIDYTISSARVSASQQHGQWRKLVHYATTTGEANSENAESLLDVEPGIAEEVAMRSPPNGVNSTANGNGANGNGLNGGIIPEALGDGGSTDWSRSYYGLSSQPFPKEIAEILEQPIDPADIEMKPDGLIYLPEIKYRRILNKSFGPGGWGLAPRTETNVGPRMVSREYALVCLGRLVAIARGEQEYFDPSGIPTATEACKSNALMRCCKDLGIASELWDPRFIREFKAKYCQEVFVEHIPTKKRKKLWRRKEVKFEYPWKE